jgi:predicted nucleic acid-binding protein
MPVLLWDASALAKRYSPELGSDTVDVLFQAVPSAQMVITFQGYAETLSVLVRKRNRGQISPATFAAAKSLLRLEILENPDLNLIAVDVATVLDGIELIERHNLNESDAATLAAFLRYSKTPSIAGQPVVVIGSDNRLLRAAQAEGLMVLNPETLSATDVPRFLASQ